MVAFSTFVHAAPAAVPQEAPPASLAAPALTGVPDTTVKTSANAATATGTTAATAPGNTASAGSSAPGEAKQYDCSFFKSGGQPSAFPDPSKWLSGEQLWQLHLKDTQKVNADAFTDQTAGLAAIKTALIDFPWSLGIPELEGVGSGLFVAKAMQEVSIAGCASPAFLILTHCLVYNPCQSPLHKRGDYELWYPSGSSGFPQI